MKPLSSCLAVLFATSVIHIKAAENEPLPKLDPLSQDEQTLFEPFERQAGAVPRKPLARKKGSQPPAPAAKIPEDFRPWWIKAGHSSIGVGSSRLSTSLDSLYVRAIKHSSQIRVFSDLPLIRETGIQEAGGAFDTNSFIEGKFLRENEPVGSTLTTGGQGRFKQDDWSLRAGLRKKLITGTEVSLTREIGRTDNNSIFFTPNPQSRARLSLSVVQPLLRGAGIGYNRATMDIASLDSEVAMNEFIRQSESHLLEIARTYWSLYAARVTLLQKQKLVEETSKVTEELRSRRAIDAQKSQLFRAESALAERRSDLVRQEAAVRNAQDRLKALTSDPSLLTGGDFEIIPTDRLVLSSSLTDARAAAYTALRNRPEINQAFLQLRAAQLREKMSKNELLPELNLVLEAALNGLGDGSFGDAYGYSYSKGAPGWGLGFVLSFPFENNIAEARHERRQIETRQQIDQVRTTVDSVLLEVKVSAREVATSYREAQAKYEAVRAFSEDISTIEARRSLLAMQEEAQVSNYLDTLLDAQDRRTLAEEEFIRSAANYQISIVNLERAKGKLLAYEDISVVRDRDEKDLPILYLQKGAGDGKSMSSGK
jgi:outer membrane protein TolC